MESGKLAFMTLLSSEPAQQCNAPLDVANAYEYIGEDPVLLASMLRLIVQRGPEHLKILRDAFAAHDWRAAKSQVHQLAPTVGMMANAPSRALLARVQAHLEDTANVADPDAAQVAGLLLADCLEQLGAAAQRHINSPV
jgi:HPt (histidine-containing phosphotransfer) domain-containing protein